MAISDQFASRIQSLSSRLDEMRGYIDNYINEVNSGITAARAVDILSELSAFGSGSGSPNAGMTTSNFEIGSEIADLINALKAMGPVEYTGKTLRESNQWNKDLETLQELQRILQANTSQATTVIDSLRDEKMAWESQAAALNELFVSGNVQYMPEIWQNMTTYDREAYARLDPEGAAFFNSLQPGPSGSQTQTTTQTATTKTSAGAGASAGAATTAPAAPPKPTRAPFPIIGNLAGKPVYGRDAGGMPPSDLTIGEAQQSGEGFTFVQKSNGLEFIPLGGGPGMGFSYEYLQNADLDALGFTGELRDSLGNVQAALQEEQAYYDQVMRDRNERNQAYEAEAAQQQRSDLLDQLDTSSRLRLGNDFSTRDIMEMIGRQQAEEEEAARKASRDAYFREGSTPVVINP